MCLLCMEEMKNKLTLAEKISAGMELINDENMTEEEKRHIRQKLFEFEMEMRDGGE